MEQTDLTLPKAARRGRDPRGASDVFFDGGCPVCRREIGWYAGLRGGETIRWVDISGDLAGISGLPVGVSQEALLRRFTIRRHDGAVVSGGAGFIAVWRALALTRPLGLAVDHAAGRWLAERAYRLFLRIRMLWRSAR